MSSTSTMNSIQLTSLFSATTYLLIYAVPLILLSIVLIFAGTFLTLDRTRNFAPRYDAEDPISGSASGQKKNHYRWFLEGGVGGLAGGYIFGAQAATFLSLLLMNETTSTPLGSTTFLIVWFLSALISSALAGRFLLATLIFMGLSGGASLAISLCIILHPALLPRVALCSVLTVLMLVFVLIPSPRTRHLSLRLCTSATGAFTFCLSAALLTHASSWGNAWDRLWISNSPEWGTAAERGFDAGFALLFAVGGVSDWALKRKFGENPDQKWDDYLAQYTISLPNANNRTGHYQPLQSFWSKISSFFHKDDYTFPEQILFPPSGLSHPKNLTTFRSPRASMEKISDVTAETHTRGVMTSPSLTPSKTRTGRGFGLNMSQSDVTSREDDLEFLSARKPGLLRNSPKKSKASRGLRLGSRRREPVQFRPVNGFSSSSDSSDIDEHDYDDEVLKTPSSGTPLRKPWVVERKTSFSSSLSGTTLRHAPGYASGVELDSLNELDVEKERAKISSLRTHLGRHVQIEMSPPNSRVQSPNSMPEYSDVEEQDVSVVVNDLRYDSDLERERKEPGWTPRFIQRAQTDSPLPSQPHLHHAIPREGMHRAHTSAIPPPPGAVPMTRSLIRALDRITQAQEMAFGITAPSKDELRISKSSSPAQACPSSPLSASVHGHETLIEGTDQEYAAAENGDEHHHGWDGFWHDVRTKAAEYVGKGEHV